MDYDAFRSLEAILILKLRKSKADHHRTNAKKTFPSLRLYILKKVVQRRQIKPSGLLFFKGRTTKAWGGIHKEGGGRLSQRHIHLQDQAQVSTFICPSGQFHSNH